MSPKKNKKKKKLTGGGPKAVLVKIFLLYFAPNLQQRA
jgi:hypothetical protein